MNEIEEKFYKCFGIKQLDRYLNCKENLEGECQELCELCDKSEYVYCYPPITNRVLLELICFLSEWRIYCNDEYKIHSKNIKNLKEMVLLDCIDMFSFYKCKNCEKDAIREVRKLFEEGEE